MLTVVDHAAELDLDTLPPRFVAKTNHGSNFYIIATEKSTLDRAHLIRQFKLIYFKLFRHRQYFNLYRFQQLCDE